MAPFGPPNVEKMKTKKNVRGLIKALAYSKDAGISVAAALALVEIREPAIEPLIHALNEENEDVRQAAAEALAKIGEPAIPPLIAALKHFSTREGAAGVLLMLGDPAVRRAVEQLVIAFDGEDDDARGAAIEAMVEIGRPAVEPLIAALSNTSLNKRKIDIKYIVVVTDTEELIPHHLDLRARVSEVLQDKGLSVRGAAAGALGMIGDARAIDPLIAVLRDDDMLLRWIAAGVLFEFGATGIFEVITTLNDDDLLLTGIGTTLVLIGDARTVKPLIAKLNEKDGEVHKTPTELLRKLGWKRRA